MAYTAFISYSHAADGKLAPALQLGLHRFAKPWYRLRALHVFRDKTSLSANPALWPSIEKALAESKFFLLMASPVAAQSPWVQQEVDWWLTNRSIETVLIVLTEGEIAWNGMEGDFDWTLTTALPRRLSKRFAHEPLYVDLRWAQTEEKLSLRHPQFRAAVLDIAAPLHGKAKDSVDGEDVRENRRTRRIAWAAACGLLVLTVSSVVGAYLAIQQRNLAEERRQVAVVRQLIARAELARSQARKQLPQSVLLATEVIKRTDAWSDVPLEVHQILHRGLDLSPRLVAEMRHDAEVKWLRFTGDGRYLVSASQDGTARLWEPSSGIQVARMSHGGPVLALGFGLAGEVLMTASADHTHRYWRMPLGLEVGRIDVPENAGRVIAFSPKGGFATVDGNDDIWISGSRPKQLTRLTRNAEQPLNERLGLVRSVAVLAYGPEGRYLAAGLGSTVAALVPSMSQQSSAVIWEVPSQREVARFPAYGAVLSLAFTPDAKLLAAGGADNKARVWHIERKEKRLEISHEGWVNSLAFSADGKLIATGSNDSTASIWNISSGTEVWRVADKGSITSVAISPDGSLLATGSIEGLIRVWDVNLPARGVSVIHGAAIWSDALSASGDRLATFSADGVLQVSSTKGAAVFRTGGNQKAPGHVAGGEVAIGERGDLVAVLGDDGSATVWDTQGRSQVVRVAHGGKGAAVAITEVHKLLATGGDDGVVRLWDLPSGHLRNEFSLGSKVSSLVFSIDGMSLAGGTSGGDIVLLNLKSAVEVLRGRHGKVVTDAAFSRDGQWMASRGEDNIVLVWNLNNPKAAHKLENLRFGHGLAFSPDSRFLVAGDSEFARIWESSSWRAVARVPMGDFVHTVAMDDRQQLIASIGEDLAREYRLVTQFWSTPDVVREVCGRIISDLSEEERRDHFGDEPYRAICPDTFIPLQARLEKAVEHAAGGADREALLAFEDLTERAVALANAPRFANQVCWMGSTHGVAVTVMPACEHAVRTAPDLIRPLFLDSRGLARAMTGDLAGAIADFSGIVRALEKAEGVDAFVGKRKGWIASLEKGQNPFSPSELAALRKE